MRIEERRVSVALGVVLALAVALFPALARALLSDHAYWIQIYIWILFFAMCATAWNIIGGFAGQYSFGHAAFLGIGAYTSTLMYLNLGVSPWLGMIVGGIVAALAGAVISYPCFRLRGAFFSLATIAFAEMLRVGGELTDTVFGILINGARGLVIPPVGDSLWALQFRDKESYAYVIYGLLLVTLAVAFTVKNSRLGYYLAAIGDDEDAVKSLGIDTARAKLIALLVSAFFTAVAGSFYAQMVLFITPTRAVSLDLSVQMVIMAVLGGLGSVFGPLLGACILVPVAELTRAALGGSTIQGAHLIVYGALLMLVVRFVPGGIESHVREGCRQLVALIADALHGAAAARPAAANAPIMHLPTGGGALGVRAAGGRSHCALPLECHHALWRCGWCEGSQHRGRPRRGRRPDRAERVGQDHDLQSRNRLPGPAEWQDPLRRPFDCRPAAASSQPSRHRADFSDRAALHQHDGCRERYGGGAPTVRHALCGAKRGAALASLCRLVPPLGHDC